MMIWQKRDNVKNIAQEPLILAKSTWGMRSHGVQLEGTTGTFVLYYSLSPQPPPPLPQHIAGVRHNDLIEKRQYNNDRSHCTMSGQVQGVRDTGTRGFSCKVCPYFFIPLQQGHRHNMLIWQKRDILSIIRTFNNAPQSQTPQENVRSCWVHLQGVYNFLFSSTLSSTEQGRTIMIWTEKRQGNNDRTGATDTLPGQLLGGRRYRYLGVQLQFFIPSPAQSTGIPWWSDRKDILNQCSGSASGSR